MILFPAMMVTQTSVVEFRLGLPTMAKSVSVAGTFNGWNKAINPMKSDDGGKTWRLSLAVPYGQQQYKFVIDDSRWIPDPTAKSVDDGNGNVNSALVVVPDDYRTPAAPRDSRLTRSGLSHSPGDLARTYDRGELTFTLRTRVNDADQVFLLLDEQKKPMKASGRDDLYAYWTAQSAWNGKKDLRYSFLADGQIFGSDSVVEASSKHRPEFKLSAKGFQPFVVPSWVSYSVIYQIFPDRFANGKVENDPSDVQPWSGKPTYSNRFGGDAVGVAKHADYLKSLGINTIYFNPVFKSPSNHRYEAEDYKLIDPQFGTNEEFAEMGRTLEKSGIGIVLDFAFNHTSPGFSAFKDVIANGEASKYKYWYFIKSYPVTVKDNPPYEAWYGFPSMPKLNTVNPETSQYLLSVTPFWKATLPNLKGVRLDVGNEVDPRFWREFRTANKKLDPNLWILGEVWGDGNPWLKGDQWDSVMNYPFRDALVRYFTGGSDSLEQMFGRLQSNLNSYPPQVQRNLMNFLSTHDTARFLTLAKGDRKSQKLAATIQFTWPGAPSIYYGEEIGMEGGVDPDNRRGMRWDLVTKQNDLLEYYRRLIAIRKSHDALTEGDVTVLSVNSGTGTAVYRRTFNEQSVWVVFNNSDANRNVPIAGSVANSATDLLGQQPITRSSGQTSISLRPRSAAIVAAPASRSIARDLATTTTLTRNSEIIR